MTEKLQKIITFYIIFNTRVLFYCNTRNVSCREDSHLLIISAKRVTQIMKWYEDVATLGRNNPSFTDVRITKRSPLIAPSD